MKRKILCVDDEMTIQQLVKCSLPEFEIIPSLTLKDALAKIKKESFIAIILDLHLPDGDGLDLLSESYLAGSRDTPFIVLSAFTEIQNKVMAFTLGAEDFLAKPFNPIELNVRVQAKLKKAERNNEESKIVNVGNLKIDFDLQKVFLQKDNKETNLGLTSTEIKLLAILTKRVEQVFSRSQLLDLVWQETHITDRTIDSHIAHLRKKISDSSVSIETVKNLGYRSALK